MTYRLQNRYQDSGWEECKGYESNNLLQIELTAKQCSENSIAYGMVRVVSNAGVHSVFTGGYRLDPATNKRLGIETLEPRMASIRPVGHSVEKGQQVLRDCGVEPAIYHASPYNAKPGSFIDRAERWFRSRGLAIPDKRQFPHSFNGMLDDYTDHGGE